MTTEYFLANGLSRNHRKIIDIAESIRLSQSDELGFVCRSMVLASMPHSKVKGLQYKRENGRFKLTIVSGDDECGLPYGTYPRLILSWLTSEIVRTKSREIILGDSLADFMKKLGLSVSGGRWGTVSRFKDQIKKLFSSTITYSYEDKKSGKWIIVNMHIADQVQIKLGQNDVYQVDFFKSKIILGESFYKEVLQCPIPVDLRAINALKDSSLALDIYFWLTYRMGYLSSQVMISFDNLQAQFGAGYDYTPHGRYEFKRKFMNQLRKVKTIYPDANIKILPEGLFLSPSKTHVVKKIKSNKITFS